MHGETVKNECKCIFSITFMCFKCFFVFIFYYFNVLSIYLQCIKIHHIYTITVQKDA